MEARKGEEITANIIDQAKKLGACLAGIANVAALKTSPSHIVFGKIDQFRGVGAKETGKVRPGQVAWPDDAKSALVIAVEHPENVPQLDWWQDGLSGGTAGNRILIDVNLRLSARLKKEMGYHAQALPYHIENGGIFLKDAAVMAGLGCIGKNNMLVTADYGPRVRLRAMLLDAELPATGPLISIPVKIATCPAEPFVPKKPLKKEFILIINSDRTSCQPEPAFTAGIFATSKWNGMPKIAQIRLSTKRDNR